MQWVTRSTPEVSVKTGTVYRLQFTSLTAGPGGPALDNIQLVLIPEPGAAATLLTGGLLLGWLLRRKNATP